MLIFFFKLTFVRRFPNWGFCNSKLGNKLFLFYQFLSLTSLQRIGLHSSKFKIF